MIKKILGLIFLALLIPNLAYAQENWVQSGLQENRIKTLETTPWGLLAGEYDTRLWLTPHNGLFISKDLGETWVEMGLQSRGVTDISYSNKNIYVSTYYFEGGEAGLFISKDQGTTWTHAGENISTSTVSAQGNTVILGTYSHGLWVSKNNGASWNQTIGDGFYGPEILKVFTTPDIFFVATPTQVFKSIDGVTWESIPQLDGNRIENFTIAESMILAGTTTNGIFKSIDLGITWEKLSSWGNASAGALTYYNKTLFASKQDGVTGIYDVLESKDLGNTWIPTNLITTFNEGYTLDFTTAFSYPMYLFASIPIEGIYKLPVYKPQTNTSPLFDIPWNTSSAADLIEKVYSYFDHEYPLINYAQHPEPLGTRGSVLNFRGIKGSIPQMYYSGHDGIDFALKNGETVLSAGPGIARYEWSKEKGHTIIIDHQNNYETEYAHLQPYGLIVNDTTFTRSVVAGQKVGLVGTSGYTTGPHLHFAVTKDGIPYKKVDPFGWQNEDSSDPWANYSWTDINGNHSGVESIYLWKKFPEVVAKYIDANGGEVILNNKKIIVDINSSEEGFTVFVEPYELPKVPVEQNRLSYITGTSMLVNIYNILGEKPPLLLKPAKIEMDFSNANLGDIMENTIKFYFWNEDTLVWEEITSLFDIATKRLTGETYHFSHIAAFGNKIFKKVVVTGALFKIIG